MASALNIFGAMGRAVPEALTLYQREEELQLRAQEMRAQEEHRKEIERQNQIKMTMEKDRFEAEKTSRKIQDQRSQAELDELNRQVEDKERVVSIEGTPQYARMDEGARQWIVKYANDNGMAKTDNGTTFIKNREWQKILEDAKKDPEMKANMYYNPYVRNRELLSNMYIKLSDLEDKPESATPKGADAIVEFKKKVSLLEDKVKRQEAIFKGEFSKMKDEEKVSSDYTLAEGGVRYDKNNVPVASNPKTEKSDKPPNFQEKGVTEIGGFTIFVNPDPKNPQTLVVKPNGEREIYDPKKFGKILSTNISQTNIYNEDKAKKEGFASWTPEAKHQTFMYNLITLKPPVSAQGMRSNDRQAYAKEYAQWQVDQGFSPQDISLMQSDYRAGDMSLKNMARQEAPMSAFVGNLNKQIEKVQELYNNNDRTGIRLLDLPIRELKLRVKGSGDEAVKASYLLEISNEIGKLSSGASASVQQLSDSAKEDWKKVHDVNLSSTEIMKVVNATRDQANMRMSSWREAKEEVRKQLRSVGVKGEPSPETSNVLSESSARKQLSDKGILGKDQDDWINKYKEAGKVR